MRIIRQSSNPTLAFLMVSSADHTTGMANLTVNVKTSKFNGAASMTPGVTAYYAPYQIDPINLPGWYSIRLTMVETDTVGDLIIRVTASGADQTDRLCVVEAADISDLDTEVLGIKAKTDQLVFAGGKIDATVSIDTASIAGAVWASATRKLTGYGENYLLHSEEFDHASWLYGGGSGTIIPNAAIGPYGLMTADKLVDAVGSAIWSDRMQQVSSEAFAVNQVYTASVFVKSAGVGWVNLSSANTSPQCGAWFNLTSGTVETVMSNVVAATMVYHGNGWYRCSITVIPTSTSLGLGIYTDTSDGTDGYSLHAGDGVSGIYIWGAQIELGCEVTQYQPTTTEIYIGSVRTGSATSSSMTTGGTATHIVVNDESGAHLDGVACWVTTDTEGVHLVAGTVYTDSFGAANFMLDAGTYYLWRQRNGINFTNPSTIVVAG